MGRATSRAPLSTVPLRPSAASVDAVVTSLLREDRLEHGPKLLLAERLEGARGDLAVPVDDQRRGNGLRVEGAPLEAEHQLARRVVETRVAEVELLLEGLRQTDLGVAGVDADELDALVLDVLVDRLEVRRLGTA